ncbi:DMT family transporter [Variovorax sp. J22R133]|uniref:DMT family transporter n=1 Tax=Variovorax brevis TaxID=3053503 RepID=UPI0025753598|nr:DMT family transporter [Variovorax sp. J22R133]MDM0115370.1 DMT family transporter [Variovorax sp. J22R133]
MPATPSSTRLSPRAIGIGAAVITVVVWTAFIVIARASAARSLTPFDITFARVCGASLFLLPAGFWLVTKARRTDPAAGSLFGLSPLPLRITAIAGALGGVAYAVLAYAGFFYAPAAHASVLMPGSLPLWTALLAAWFLRDRITPARALGLALIVAGDLLVGGRSLLNAFEGGEVWKGDLLFMSAAFCWACYSVLARRHGLDAVRATIALTVFAFMTYVPVYLLIIAAGWVNSHIGTAPWGEFAFQMFFQGVGSVVISGITFTRMIQHFGPVRSTMITAVVPGLSALGAVIFLDEPLYWNLIAGLLLVTAGILFGVQKAAAGKVAAAASVPRVAGQADA